MYTQSFEGVVPLSNSPPKLAPIEDLLPKDAEGRPLAIKRKPGRPRKVVVPTVHELELAKLVNQQRDEFVDSESLVRSVEGNAPTSELLRAIVMELALESAALRLEIRSAQSASKSDGLPQKHSRRIDALVKIASITLEAHKLGLVDVDLKSEAVQRVCNFLVATVEEAADVTLADASVFKRRFRVALVGWEHRVERGGSE